MYFRGDKSGGVRLSKLDPFIKQLLLSLPEEAGNTGSEAAQDRILPHPGKDVGDDFMDLWREEIQPELLHIFQSSVETVRGDLQQLDEGTKNTVKIPGDHKDAWLNALNQARLCIAANEEFNEGDMADMMNPRIDNERDLALFKVHFFGLLQELLLREGQEDGSK